ncbi:MAG: hypothetical protein RL477_455 [Pseudomonadota bacterium]
MNNRHLYWLAGVLTAVGLAVFFYKVLVLRYPVTPDRLATSWRIEARIDFSARGGPVLGELLVPRSTTSRPIFNESYVAGDFGIASRDAGDNRAAVFSVADADGPQTFYYRATVELVDDGDGPMPAPPPSLNRVPMSEAELAAARSLLARLRPRAAGTPTLVGLLITALRNPRPGDEATLLLGTSGSTRRIVDTAVKVLRQGGIPARRVNGFALVEDRRIAPVAQWLEVYVDDRWTPFQASDGAPGVPPRHVAWWRGEQGPVTVTGADVPRVQFSISMAHQFALRRALERGRETGAEFAEFSLFRLPFQTQQVYRVLMVVPVGILILVLLRNVVGVKTFGTFMPVLIAMAFRETNLVWGIVLFSTVVFLGISVRFYLEHLKLLLVPRLAAIVIVVIGVMALMSIVSFKLGFIGGLSVALFPIVILTMTIERMTVVWDERGAREALTQAAGSLIVAVICYLVMNNKAVGHLAFVFPETLLLLLAFILLLGRYSGYRLTELGRFRVLAGKDKP